MHPEALDIEDFESLARYLRDTGRAGPGERLRMSLLAGGVSNRTVLVERASGESWVIKQALPKLRVAVDWFSSPERIEREGEGLRWLPRLTWQGASPELVFEDPARHLLAMRAVPQPHENWKSMLLAGRIDPDHVRQFGELLGALHANGYRMRGELAAVFENRSFFESLRLEPYYAYTATVVPEAAPFLNALIADTLATRLTVVHGDYSPKNVLVYQGRLVLLDHEDFHWTLITEDEHTHVVQLARAKELVGELLVFPAEIAYVQVEPSETDGEWLFECVVESEKAREVAYHFVMAHEYEDGEHRREEKWTH
jgi:tRNA A-37 threonylcarbamoyl transferase component Bud32